MKTLMALAVGLLVAAPALAAPPFSLHYIGQNIVPTGTIAQGTEIGGLSGIDYSAATGHYYAISDSHPSQDSARYYTLTLDLDQFKRNANPGHDGVAFVDVTLLLSRDGKPFPPNTVDPESIRFRAGVGYWASEGELPQGLFVRAMDGQGGYRRDFPLPRHYLPDNTQGIRDNKGFESLSFANDGKTLYAATENALQQDDAQPATLDRGSRCRLLAFDTNTGTVVGEYVYLTDPVVAPPKPAGGAADNGLAELLNVPGHDNAFIALERSFSKGVGVSVRLYWTRLDGADHVVGVATLGEAVVPMRKELLLDLGTLTHADGASMRLDNIEGITWGPQFRGHTTLILVSDNNFNTAQATQFLAFEVRPTDGGNPPKGAGRRAPPTFAHPARKRLESPSHPTVQP